MTLSTVYPGQALTEKETRLLERFALGESNKLAAKHLYVTPNTVGTHKKRIFKKLGAHTTAHAVALAIKKGYISCEMIR